MKTSILCCMYLRLIFICNTVFSSGKKIDIIHQFVADTLGQTSAEILISMETHDLVFSHTALALCH